jgi:hypothetical protein
MEPTKHTPKTTEIIQHFIEELKSPYKPLTTWEENFIISIEDQFSRRRTLSDKQFETLERIYAEKTA